VVVDGVGSGGRVVGVGGAVVTVGRVVGEVDVVVGAGVAEGAVTTVVCELAIGVSPAPGVPEEHAVVSASAHPATTTTRRMPLT
jgi:hypothetical protein